MNVGAPPSSLPPAALAKIKPRAGNMKPMTQALQLALFRVDRGDTVPRINKLGELVVRKALAGDTDMIKLVFERIDGKAMPLDDKGEPVDLHQSTLTKLIELLHAQKTRAIDTDYEVVEGVRKE